MQKLRRLFARGPGPADSDLSPDDVFDIISNGRRRDTISLLADVGAGESVSLDWLAKNVACIEYDFETPEAVDSDARKRVYVGLYQAHLPKLDELGVIQLVSGPEEIVVTKEVERLDAAAKAATAAFNGRGW